ncbi:MAG: hypothetical protein VX597_04590 [Pseudomonadota bacterium]|nr:hypothetical protein [Pseudomonadota bacterium]
MDLKTFEQKGTATALSDEGLDAQRIDKITEERPNIQGAMLNREEDLVIITPLSAAEEFGV